MLITIKQKQIITISTLVLLALVIIFIIVLPTMRSIDVTVQTISVRALNEDAELQRLRLLRRSLQEIEVAQHDVQHISATTMKASVDEVKIDDLLKVAGAQHGVVMEVSYTKEVSSHEYFKEQMNYTITATGSFDQVRAFLAKVESLPYYIQFTNLEIERLTPTEENNAHIKMTLTGFFFIAHNE